jgi:hypothetical protein
VDDIVSNRLSAPRASRAWPTAPGSSSTAAIDLFRAPVRNDHLNGVSVVRLLSRNGRTVSTVYLSGQANAAADMRRTKMNGQFQSPFVPDDFAVPSELVTDQFRLQPLGPEHNAEDYQAWTSSMDHIHATPGYEDSSWPKPMTLADNLADLERHAADFAARSGFTYTVLDTECGDIIGCVYIYPSEAPGGARVESWVRADRATLDGALYNAVLAWLKAAWPFTVINYAER